MRKNRLDFNDEELRKISKFGHELDLIKNEKLRIFVSIMLAGTGDWFFKDPASTSGKHHPSFALGEGGLVRHTKAVVYWLHELIQAEVINQTTTLGQDQIDALTAAAILHDIRKHTADGKYVENHARAAYEAVLECYQTNQDLIERPVAQYIADCILTHMGKWGKGQGNRTPCLVGEKLIHLADYCASRKEPSFE